ETGETTVLRPWRLLTRCPFSVNPIFIRGSLHLFVHALQSGDDALPGVVCPDELVSRLAQRPAAALSLSLIAEQFYNSSGKAGGFIGDQKVSAVLHGDAFHTERRADNGLAAGH